MLNTMKHIEIAKSTQGQWWLKGMSVYPPNELLKELSKSREPGWCGMFSIAYYRSLANWTLLNGQWIKRH